MFIKEYKFVRELLKECGALQKKLTSVKRNRKLAGRLSERLETIETLLKNARDSDLPELKEPRGKKLLQDFDSIIEDLTRMIDRYSAEPDAFLAHGIWYLGKIKHGSEDMAEFLEKEAALELAYGNLKDLFQASMPIHFKSLHEKMDTLLKSKLKDDQRMKEDLESDRQARDKTLQEMLEFNKEFKELREIILQVINGPAQEPIPFQPALNANVREIAYNDLKFDKHSPLGQGSFGQVYVGTWRGTPVAIKRLIDNDSDEVMRREAQVHASLCHPNVIQFLGAVYNPEPCLVMRYAEEGSLQKALCEGKVKTPFQALSIFKGVVAGLIYLHECRVVHRDLKAANVLLTSADLMRAEIADFGLARVKAASSRSTKSQSRAGRSAAGSKPWQAPEVLKSGHHTFAGDVYACGMLFFEMCTFGKSPFHDVQDIFDWVVHLKNQERLPRGTPDAWVKLFKSMTDPEPVKRPTLRQILETVERMLQGYANQGTPVQVPAETSSQKEAVADTKDKNQGSPLQAPAETSPQKEAAADTKDKMDQGSSDVLDVGRPRPVHPTHVLFLETLALAKYSKKFEKSAVPVTAVSTDHLTSVAATFDVAALKRSRDFRNLTKALSEGDSETQTVAARAFNDLCRNEDNHRVKAVEAGCLPPLVSLLRDGTAEGKTKAAGAIRNIAMGSNNHEAMAVEAGCLAPLVSLLRDGTAEGKTEAAGAIRNIVADGNNCQAKAVDAGCLAPLVNLLRDGTAEGKTQAASAIGSIAWGDNNCVAKVVEAGCLAPLVSLLRDGTAEGKTSAAAAIKNIVADGNNCGAKVVEAGCLPPLVSLLRDGTAEGKTWAACTIWSITASDNNLGDKVVEAGCLAPLVSLLRDGTAVGKTNAAGAIRNIAMGGNNCKAKVVEAGCLPPLVNLLRDGTVEGKTQAAGTIWSITAGDNNLEDKVVEAGCLSPLVSLLRDGTAEGKTWAAAAMKNIVVDGNNCKVKAVEAGCLAPLVNLLRNGTVEGKTQAAMAIKNIAYGDNNLGDKAVEAGCLPPLVSLLRDGTAEGKTEAAMAFTNIAAGDNNRKAKAVEAGCLAPLVSLLQDGTAVGKTRAAETIMSIAAGDKNCRAKVMEAGCAPLLVNLFKTGEIQVGRQKAVGALFNLALNEDNSLNEDAAKMIKDHYGYTTQDLWELYHRLD